MKVHICSFARGNYQIEVSGEWIQFEDNFVCGPMPVTKRGYERSLRVHHPFWRIVSLWICQGKRHEAQKCIWHEPKRPVLEQIIGKHYRVLQEGETGWDW